MQNTMNKATTTLCLLLFIFVFCGSVYGEAFVDFSPGATELLATEEVLNRNSKPVESEHVAMAYDEHEQHDDNTVVAAATPVQNAASTQQSQTASATTKLNYDNNDELEKEMDDMMENDDSAVLDEDEDFNDEAASVTSTAPVQQGTNNVYENPRFDAFEDDPLAEMDDEMFM